MTSQDPLAAATAADSADAVQETQGGSLERLLAVVLEAGTYVSIGLVIAGSGLLALEGPAPAAGGPPFAIDRVLADLAGLRPAGLLWLGILGILATPVLRVAVGTAGLARRAETAFAAVGLGTMLAIAVGVFVGVTAH